MSCGNLLDWRFTKKARLMSQDISSSTRQKKWNAMFCTNRPATYKESVVTMTETINDVLLMLEIWFFDVSRMKQGCTSLIRDGRDPSSCTRLHDQGHIAYSTLMARISQTPGISSIYDVFILSQPRHLHAVSHTGLLNPTCRISLSFPSCQLWHFRMASCEFS
jgi:hypothetical protein